MREGTAVSLFSGIGGFELGLSRSGFRPVLFCEIDALARSILAEKFPGIPIRKDIRKLRSLPDCQLLAAGWPCQDLSQAGLTRGIGGKQSSLIAEVFRLLRASSKKPDYVLLENVAFSLHLRKGEAVQQVVSSLEDLGYRWAYRVLDTIGFGLPQRRRRIFILGSLKADPYQILFDVPDSLPKGRKKKPRHVGFYWTEGNRGIGWTEDAIPPLKGGSSVSIPSAPAIWNSSNGKFFKPGILDSERLQGFPSGWTYSEEDNARRGRKRWQLVGNSVSVPVSEWIGHRIAKIDEHGAKLNKNSRLQESRRHNAACGGPKGGTEFFRFEFEGPSNYKRYLLSDFDFEDKVVLSSRAASGFLHRYRKSPLTKNEPFLSDLIRYCDSKSEIPAT